MKLSARWQCVSWLSALSLLAGLLPEALDFLAWRRDAISEGQWGRLLTGHLVHLDQRHLWFNLLGLLVIAELLLEGWQTKTICSLLLASAAGTSLFLWVGEPGLHWYAGLSGLLHGLWAGGALTGWLGTRRWLFGTALALLATKLLFLNQGSDTIPVLPVSHVYGAASGLLWAWVRSAPFPWSDHFD